MMRLAVVLGVVFLVAIAAGAAVFIKQDQHDFSQLLSFTDAATSSVSHEPATPDPSSSAARTASEPGSRVAAIPPQSDPPAEPEAVASQPKGQPDHAAERPEDRLAFDIARVHREGVSVFAGQGAPGHYVDILADGVVIGTARVDENGEWVFVTEHDFASDDPKLDLQVGTAPSEKQVAAKADTEVVADVRAEAATVRNAARDDVPSPKVRELNDRMMSDLQELVDEARREEAGHDAGGHPDHSGDNAIGGEADTAERTGGEAGTRTGPAGEKTFAAAADPARDGPVVSRESAARKTIPIPVQFVYREATFTPDGEKAANLLLQYLQLGKLSEVTLSGHADERGTEALNMELSRQRLKTVENYLRSGGYEGKLELVPQGKSEPFAGVDRTGFSREELFQLDRRVELRLAK